MWASNGNRGDNKEMKKFVLYTAVFGRAGKSRTHDVVTPNVDRICFTDMNIGHDGYQMRRGDEIFNFNAIL